MLAVANILATVMPMSMKINPDRLPVSDLVRNARRGLDMTQADLAQALGKSRWWVIQLEKGERYASAKEFELEPLMCVKIADVLNLDPTIVLTAADIPQSEWPNFSNVVAKSENVRHIDVTTLSVKQSRLIAELVEEMKRGNAYEKGATT